MRKLAKVSVAATSALSTFLVGAQNVLASSYSRSSVDDGVAAGASIVWLVTVCCSIVIGLVLFAFNIWMLIDAAKRDESVLPNKTMWVVLMGAGLIFGGWGFFVAVYYYFARKRKLDQMS